jgi:CRP-like cAMP-binding protein
MYYYQASSDLEVYQAPEEDVLALIKSDVDLLLAFLGQSHLALERTANKMNRLMSGNARDLIIFDLLTEVRANGKVDPEGRYVVSISEQELGARAGLTRETVSREINKLKDLDLLKTNRGRIILTDIMALESRLQNFA